MLFQAVSSDADLAGTTVTTRPPDRARQDGSAGNQINLFLYRTSIDAAWRNQDPPGIRPGESGQPPLPLVLSYLMTAYGEDDDEVLAHRLLGVGMQVLNDQPLLSPSAIVAALSGSGLEDQPDRVRITPHPIPMDEISRLWATFSTGYRISASYDAAVVLIDNNQPLRAPLPVLARSAGDLGPHAGAPGGAVPPGSPRRPTPARRPPRRRGDPDRPAPGRRVPGPGLGRRAERTRSCCRSPRRPAGALTVQMPTDPPLPAGVIAVTAQVTVADGDTLASNAVPLVLVPVITSTAPLAATLSGGSATIEVTCSPPVLASQTVALVVGSQIVAGTPGAAGSEPRTSLSFTLQGFTAGSYVLRLRVDGQDSIPVVAGPDQLRPQPAPGAVMTALTDWESRNSAYLADGLQWLRGLPDRAASPTGPATEADAWWNEHSAWPGAGPAASARAAWRPSGPVPLRAPHPAAVRGHGIRPGDGGPLRSHRRPAGERPAHICPGAQHPARTGLGRPVPAAAAALLAAGRGAPGCRAAAGGQPAARRRADRELHQGPQPA